MLNEKRRAVVKFEDEARRIQQAMRSQPDSKNFNLDQVRGRLAGNRRALGDCERQLTALRGQLESQLKSEQEKLPERRSYQEKAAAIVPQIVAKDEEIQTLMDALRQRLQERRDLSAEISSQCQRLDFWEDAGWSRLTTLFESLPESVLPQTQTWARQFLGDTGELPAYVVVEQRLELPETLAHCGLHSFGDVVHLADAGELLREDRPGVDGRRFRTPSVMQEEQFRAVQAAARDDAEVMAIVLRARRGDDDAIWAMLETAKRFARAEAASSRPD